jgi:hypothetical protein
MLLFNISVIKPASDSIASSDMTFVSKELEVTYKEVTLAYLKLLSMHFPVEGKKKSQNPQSG